MARKTKKDPVEGAKVSVSVVETHETAAEVRARNKKVRNEVCVMTANEDEEPKPADVVWFLPTAF